MKRYSDLLATPFVLGGRDARKGMDCYGLCIEMCARDGKALADIASTDQKSGNFARQTADVNVREITEEEADSGDLVQCVYSGEVHLAYMLDKRRVLHATYEGVRVSPVAVLKDRKFFRVV